MPIACFLWMNHTAFIYGHYCKALNPIGLVPLGFPTSFSMVYIWLKSCMCYHKDEQWALSSDLQFI